MAGGSRWPHEVLVLAALWQLGRVAAELLGRGGMWPWPPCPGRGAGGSAGRRPPVEELAEVVGWLREADWPPAGRQNAGRRAGRRFPAHPQVGQEAAGGAKPPQASPRGLEAWESRVRETVRAVETYWEGQPVPPSLERYGEDVDPSSPQGRWEMLALALLRGGPVPVHRVEETFCRLRADGLLELAVVARAGRAWAASADEVLRRCYRGPVDRRAILERLVRAARTLTESFQGDLDAIWREAVQDPERCRALVRDHFPGLDRMAGWLLRELGRKGVWPQAHRHPASLYVDPHARKAMEHLELVGAGTPLRQVESLLRGLGPAAAMALAFHGRDRCGRRSLAVCLGDCPVSRLCGQLRRWERTGEGVREAGTNRETPVKRPAGARQVRGEPAGGAAITDGGAVPLASRSRRVETGQALTGVSRCIV